jgi:putative ABC transport system permease protein
LRALPQVSSAAEAVIVPMSGSGWNDSIIIDNEKKGESYANQVSENYFKTLGTPLLAGRDFNNSDTPTSPRVAIVNESFARKFFQGQSPLGKTIRLEVGPKDPDHVYEIVGLVKDTKYRELREESFTIVYFSESQNEKPQPYIGAIINSNASLTDLIPAVKSSMGEINSKITLFFRPMNSQVKDAMQKERMMAILSGFFGLLAALLANIGLYGVMSYMVAQRSSEIGIRMALGADRARIVRMIVGEAGLLVTIGLFVGTIIALGVTRTASSFLFGLQPNDALTFGIAIATLAMVGLLASYLPAYRASKLDPIVVLRHD